MKFFYLSYCNIIQLVEKKILNDNNLYDKEIIELYEELLINMYEFIGNNIEHFSVLESDSVK